MIIHGKNLLWVALLVAAVGCDRADRHVAASLQAAGNALARLDFAAEERATANFGERTATFASEVFHRHEVGTRRRRLSEEGPRPPGKPRWHGGGMRFDEMLPPPRDLHLLSRNYRSRCGDRDTVAGRPCERFAWVGRNEGRPSVELWLDTATSLPLKRRDLNPRGEVMFEREIMRIEIGQRGPDALFAEGRGNDCPSAITLAEAAATLPGFVSPPVLPQGFELSEIRSLPRRRKDSAEGPSPVRLTCTDGLAKLVIYEFPYVENNPGCDRLVAHRRHVADFNVVSAALGRVRLVVCSSLAEEEVRRVLEGLCAAASPPP